MEILSKAAGSRLFNIYSLEKVYMGSRCRGCVPGLTGSLFVTHDHKYELRIVHDSREEAESERARDPKMIEVVEYVKKG